MELKERQLKLIDKALSKKNRSERWRAIVEAYEAIRPEARIAHKKFQEALAEERLGLLKSTGASKSGDTRRLTTFPGDVLAVLYRFDHDLWRESQVQDREVRKASARKLAAAFPEYTMVEKI